MSISGVGSRNTYIYNSRTGKLSSKDGQKDAFVDYFNGDISGDESDTLNGFDMVAKFLRATAAAFLPISILRSSFTEKGRS